MMKIALACLTLPAFLMACTAPSTDLLSNAPTASRHITPRECRDLAALRKGAEPTHDRLTSEAAVLLMAGYNQVTDADLYPGALHHAQRRMDDWYAQDCGM
ncbi:hypothetical protein [Burkholderia sp. WSM2232]|uniref:hypothetical protein n=1 Tax=Burkholderia sp. WSM2232 TaxID=944436 RepID=UPI001E61B49B|nr:hypothetical protein [Burkholderia sp. WSM2232]